MHVFETVTDASFVTMTASWGHQPSGPELLSTDPTSSPVSFALVTQKTVTCDDLARETRFRDPGAVGAAEAMSIIEAPIPGQDSPIGVIGVGWRTAHRFVEEDVSFVVAVANVLAAAAARTRAEDAIRDQALHDPLTGLPNRLVLAEHGHASAVAAAVGDERGRDAPCSCWTSTASRRSTTPWATPSVTSCSLEVARRLHGLGDPVEVVARLGADEFAVVPRASSSRPTPTPSPTACSAALAEPIDVGGVRLRLRAEASVSPSPCSTRPVEPSRAGPLAPGRGRHVPGQGGPPRHAALQRRPGALQPLAPRTGERARRRRSTRASCVSSTSPRSTRPPGSSPASRRSCAGRTRAVACSLPDGFIPLAEQTGMIRELTNWVLAKALSECAAWHRAGHLIPVAVNLSAATVHDPELLTPSRPP